MSLIAKYGIVTILGPEDDPALIEMILEATHHKFCKDTSLFFLKMKGINSDDLPCENPYYLLRRMTGLTKIVSECQSLYVNTALLNEKIISNPNMTKADLNGIFFEFWALRKQFKVLSHELDNRFIDLKIFLRSNLKEHTTARTSYQRSIN